MGIHKGPLTIELRLMVRVPHPAPRPRCNPMESPTKPRLPSTSRARVRPLPANIHARNQARQTQRDACKG